MATTIDELSESGLNIGEIYSLVDGKDNELIPRRQISYVSAKYQSQPIYLILGALALFYGLTQLSGSSGAALLAILVGLGLIAGFFLTRKVGVIVASSGGRLFVQTRGRNRYELLERIYADLAADLDRR